MPRTNIDARTHKEWLTVERDELLMPDTVLEWENRPQLVANAEQLCVGLQDLLGTFDGADPSHFVLRMALDDTRSVYVHSGPFTPDPAERFSLSKRAGKRAGVKPVGNPGGAGGWINGVLTPAEEALMQRVLYFTSKAVAVHQAFDDGYIPMRITVRLPMSAQRATGSQPLPLQWWAE